LASGDDRADVTRLQRSLERAQTSPRAFAHHADWIFLSQLQSRLRKKRFSLDECIDETEDTKETSAREPGGGMRYDSNSYDSYNSDDGNDINYAMNEIKYKR